MENREWSHLVEIHDKIKDHPFRTSFAVPEELRGGEWKVQFEEYRKLLLELAYTTNTIMWGKCCKGDKIKYNKNTLWCIEKTKWVHDFAGLLTQVRLCYQLSGLKDHSQDIIPGLNITRKQLWDEEGITNLPFLMMYFDRFVGYIHSYIETGVLTDITYVVTEKTTNPHNGFYFYHLCIAHMIEDGSWKLEEKVKYRGQKQILEEEARKGWDI